MKFNHDKFIALAAPLVKPAGYKMLPLQIEGIKQLLRFIEGDARWDKMPFNQAVGIIAYFFATVAHECTLPMQINGKKVFVRTFHPVTEFGGAKYLNSRYDTGKKARELGNSPAADGDGALYGGKGYVQNTGKNNARTAGEALAGAVIHRSELPEGAAIRTAFEALSGGKDTLTVNSETFVRFPILLLVPRISYLDAIHGMLTGRYTTKSIKRYITDSKHDFVGARYVINGTDKAAIIAELARDFAVIIRQSLTMKPNQPEKLDNNVALVGNSTPADANPAPVGATEVTEVVTAEVDGGTVSTETVAKNEQSVADPVVDAAPQGYGFWKKIKMDILAVTGGNASFQFAKEVLNEAKMLPFSPEFWGKITIILIIGCALYIIGRFVHYVYWNYQNKQKNQILLNNANPATRDIVLLPQNGNK
jgi:hypothetical protein